MSGQGRTSADSIKACRQRCASVTNCQHFTLWDDGGCHLQDANARTTSSDWEVTGPPSCQEVKIEVTSVGHRRRSGMYFSFDKSPSADWVSGSAYEMYLCRSNITMWSGKIKWWKSSVDFHGRRDSGKAG